MALGRTALFYRKNKASYAKKKKKDAKDGASEKSTRKRVLLNRYNRKKGTYGNGDGKDASHKGGKIVGFEKESENRGRKEKSRKKGSKRNKWNKMKSFMRKKK